MKHIRVMISMALILFCIGAVVIARSWVGSDRGGALERWGEERSKGPRQAPIQIVEYMDYECAGCRDAHRLVEYYMRQFPGQIRLQVLFFPIKEHPHAARAAMYAVCAAGQKRFWEFHEHLLASQDHWRSIPADGIDAKFRQMAEEAGLDVARLRQCVDADFLQPWIAGERAQAESRGVRGTPTFFVNEKLVVGGTSLWEELKKLTQSRN